jgi:hypothetical protein
MENWHYAAIELSQLPTKALENTKKVLTKARSLCATKTHFPLAFVIKFQDADVLRGNWETTFRVAPEKKEFSELCIIWSSYDKET